MPQWSENTAKLCVAAYALNASTGKAEAGRSLWIQGQLSLYVELQHSQGYTEPLNQINQLIKFTKEQTEANVVTCHVLEKSLCQT